MKAYFQNESKLYKRAIRYAKRLLKLNRGNKLLDVGCSYGFYSKAFNDQKFDVTGIDISKDAIKFAKNKIKNVILDNFDHHFFSNTYDAITMFDIIEHLKNPNKSLIKARKLLHQDGILIIQTPNVDSIIAKLSGNKWFWLLTPEHLFLFNISSVKKLLENCGFRVLEISTWDDWEEFIKNILFILKLKNKGKTMIFYYLIYVFLRPLFFLSLIWSKKNLGGEIYVYAEKN
ncbi:MAG: class I SAM-dependent methyltransferase [Patescibacteria group bacterium]|nr:class I SAM-dependent methyltransferase [Patescibacteria group bacterium]